MARFLKYGLTTGACAAAAAKAALIALTDSPVERVVIPTPIGIRFEIPVKSSSASKEGVGVAVVVKDAGDDVDVTDELEITATIKLTDNNGEIQITGGKGVGKITKPGLPMEVGESAINPVPRKMISDAVKEALPIGKGAAVTVTIPEGEKVAEKTQNSKLGIVGGVSILGTTGVVKPFSEAAWRRSMVPQIDVALARGYERLFFVPGNIGQRLAKQLFGVPYDQIVQTGDFVGYMLEKAAEKGVGEIVFFGHSGKLAKLAAGIFNTHHKMGDARNEVIAAYAAAAGADTKVVKAILQSNTTEEATKLLIQADLLRETYDEVAKRINLRLTERTQGKIKFSIIIVSMDGKVLGADENARSLTEWLNLA
ncbi:MAG: cobalt-precorrin-5B (C(1))-methyltransferase CbiD [Candidatus Bathyarchaeota archaeon]|nr:cobalt-precorrin-5B (C(1))-methyltransferase CbiD [Candidatus Bathyarchaeota archaeon]